MAIVLKLKKGFIPFRNPDILAVDSKLVVLERVLTNLYMLLSHDGAPVNLAKLKREHTMESLIDYIYNLEDKNLIEGARNNPDAVEDWLRSSLVEMVNRGDAIKEKVSTLRPMHLMSFRVQNRKTCARESAAAEQLFYMLKPSEEVYTGLKNYLCMGWDTGTNAIVSSEDVDVDTAGILQLTNALKESAQLNAKEVHAPFLKAQAELFCDDIRRLLVYRNKLPRMVFIEYLRILCGLHLALYTMKIVYLLPKMVDAGSKDVEDDWSMVVDMTDRLDSRISKFACKDEERLSNNFRAYIRATYMINIAQNSLREDGQSSTVEHALLALKHGLNQAEFKVRLGMIRNDLPESSEAEFDRRDLDELVQYYDAEDYFGKFVHVLEVSNLGNSQFRYLRQFLDATMMKNSPSMLLAVGRSRKHPRRGVIGSKLLETMVQLLVLEPKAGGGYTTKSLSIEELIQKIRERYSLIINGIGEARFNRNDVEVNAAFAENMEAFKNRLRQIGFYTDLSDACILQKIRPRYKIED